MLDDRLILRGADGYDEARFARVFNARRPERYPAAVLVAESEDDVVEGVRLAQDRGWKVAEGDKVVLVDRFGGTHRGEFFGRPGTGDRIEWMAIHIYTIRDGKVLEDAVMTDGLAIMQQLGLAPNLPKAAE